MVRCNDCRNYSSDTTLAWDDAAGWHALCGDCRLVPIATAPGKFAFIKIGDK